MFMGPLRDTKIWQTKGVEGCYRFLARTHRLLDKVTDEKPDDEGLVALNKCIAKVTEETEQMRFNTAISAMMELTNACTKMDKVSRDILEPFSLLLSPLRAAPLAKRCGSVSATRDRIRKRLGPSPTRACWCKTRWISACK